MQVAVLEAAGLLPHGQREDGLQQQAPHLVEVVELETLEVPPAVLEDEDYVKLLLREGADVVVLRPVRLVPGLPLAHELVRVAAAASPHPVHPDEAGGHVRGGDAGVGAGVPGHLCEPVGDHRLGAHLVRRLLNLAVHQQGALDRDDLEDAPRAHEGLAEGALPDLGGVPEVDVVGDEVT